MDFISTSNFHKMDYFMNMQVLLISPISLIYCMIKLKLRSNENTCSSFSTFLRHVSDEVLLHPHNQGLFCGSSQLSSWHIYAHVENPLISSRETHKLRLTTKFNQIYIFSSRQTPHIIECECLLKLCLDLKYSEICQYNW